MKIFRGRAKNLNWLELKWIELPNSHWLCGGFGSAIDLIVVLSEVITYSVRE